MHSSTAAGTAIREYVLAQVVALLYWDLNFFRSPAISETAHDFFRRSPLAEFRLGACASAGDTEDWCVGRSGTVLRRQGPLEIACSRSSVGHTEAGIVVKTH